MVLSVSKALFSNVFRLHENEKPAFSNFSKNASEKLRFCNAGIRVEGRPYHRDDSVFSSFSGLVWPIKGMSDHRIICKSGTTMSCPCASFENVHFPAQSLRFF